MAVDEKQLTETISIVRERIRLHKDRLNDDEMVTRVALVDPILRVLGWDVADLDRVEVEHNYSRGAENVDYALWSERLHNSRPIVKPAGFVEAKALSDNLEYSEKNKTTKKFKAQVDRYRYYAPCIVLTNGNIWKVHLTLPATFSGSASLEFSVQNEADDLVEKFTQLEGLLRSPKPDADGYCWAPLAVFQPPPDRGAKTKWWQSATKRMPGAIKFPDADKKTVTDWSQIVERTANWLYQENRLPIGKEIKRPGYRAIYPLVTAEPQGSAHPSQWKPIGDSGMHVYTRNDYTISIQYTKALLSACKVDHENVYLQSQ